MANEWDFGFTFGNVDEMLQEKAEPELKKEVLTKLESVMQLVEANKEFVRAEAQGKLKEVENLILPLLYNLQKNPEKEYIHWPNRSEIIDAQIEKILKVTRFYG